MYSFDTMVSRQSSSSSSSVVDLLRCVIPSLETNPDKQMPELLCGPCLTELMRVQAFLEKCAKSENALKNIVETARGTAFTSTDQQQPVKPEFFIVQLTEKQEEDTLHAQEVIPAETEKPEDDYEDNDFPVVNESEQEEEIVLEEEKEAKPTTTTVAERRGCKCPECGVFFIHAKSLARHREKLHGKGGTVLESPSMVKENDDEDRKKRTTRTTTKTEETAKEKLSCDNCGFVFVNKKSLSSHVRSGRCLKASWKFSCPVCDREFLRSHFLVEHIHTHSDEATINNRTLLCTICPEQERYEFADLPTLKVHMQTHKEAPTAKHTCEDCNRSFIMYSTLKDHRRTHTGEKPFLCTVEGCGKAFSQNTNLRQHLNRHNKLKNFKCNFCPAEFVSRGELDTHLRVHTGEHPFLCHCGYKFTTSSSLVSEE